VQKASEQLYGDERPRGLKPEMASRGPEGPLFHGDAGIRGFFRSQTNHLSSSVPQLHVTG